MPDMNDKFTTYYFRYPELLLMQAELRARTGATIAEALAPINTLRNNRTNPVLSQIPEPATRNELMDIIFKEYCLELFVENRKRMVWLHCVSKKTGILGSKH